MCVPTCSILVLRSPDCCALLFSYLHQWDFFFQLCPFFFLLVKEVQIQQHSLFLNPSPDKKLEVLNHWQGDKRGLRHSFPSSSELPLAVFQAFSNAYPISKIYLSTELQFLYIYSFRSYVHMLLQSYIYVFTGYLRMLLQLL